MKLVLKSKNKILIKITSLFLISTLLFSNTCYAENELEFNREEIDTECTSDLVIDMNSGQIIYEKNIHEQLYPASTTKLLTALLAIEYGNLDDEITFNSDSVNLESGSTNLGFVEGEKISLRNLLHALLIKSANECANQLAYYIEEKSGLTYNEAASKKLQELGAYESSFTSPSGLHKSNHYTTVYDMSLIAKAAWDNEVIRDIISKISFTVPKTNKAGEREIYNTHKMLYSSSPYHLDSVIGGKTGYTEQAGHTLVTYSKQDDMFLLSITFKGENYFNDSFRLLKYFNKNYEAKTFYHKGEKFITVPIIDDSNVIIDQLDLTLSEDLTFVLPKNFDEEFKKKLFIEDYKKQIELEKEIDDIKNSDEENKNEDKKEIEINEDEIEIDLNDEFMQNHKEEIDNYIFNYKNDFFTIELTLPDAITSTVLENDVVGNIKIIYNNGEEKNISIVSKEAYDLSDSIDFTILYIILFIAFLVILVIYVRKMINLYKEEKEIKSKK